VRQEEISELENLLYSRCATRQHDFFAIDAIALNISNAITFSFDEKILLFPLCPGLFR
jgi:hypothetical protein